jgi:hypothetical protein
MVSHWPFRIRYCLSLSIVFFAIGGYCRAAAKSQPITTPPNFIRLYPPDSGWVLADLDGDHEPDFAGSRGLGRTRDGYSYQVQLLLSSDGPSNSFTLSHSNALGLKITGVDIDGDHDVDLIVSDRFLGSHVGVWLNDGRGRFVKSLPGLFSSSSFADLNLRAADPRLVGEPTGDSARRRLPKNLTGARYIHPLRIRSFASNQHPIGWIIDHAVDPFHQRSPPTGFSI